MQAEVINSVMKKIDQNMDQYDVRMKKAFQQIREDLKDKLSAQENSVNSTISNIE